MGIARAQFILRNVNGLAEDDFVNTFSFITAGTPDAADGAAIASALSDFYNLAHDPTHGGGIDSYLSPVVSRVVGPTVKVYDASTSGSPVYDDDVAALGAPAVGGNAAPDEVALCLSFNASLTGVAVEAGSIRPASRRKGRIYVGPFIRDVLVGTPSRPSTNLMATLLDAGEYLMNGPAVLTARNIVWAVHSRAGSQANPVVRVSCDDAWDTQRRRGLAPTVRHERT